VQHFKKYFSALEIYEKFDTLCCLLAEIKHHLTLYHFAKYKLNVAEFRKLKCAK